MLPTGSSAAPDALFLGPADAALRRKTEELARLAQAAKQKRASSTSSTSTAPSPLPFLRGAPKGWTGTRVTRTAR